MDFGTVVVVVVIVAALVAVLSYFRSGELYKGIGKGALSLDQPDVRQAPRPGSADARAESEAELRQLLEAKSYRRERRGEEPLDVESELAALMHQPPAGPDAELEEEVRQLVIASNERRVRRGEAPLDVEEEVARQLRDLGA